MKNTGNVIMDALEHLEQAGFDETKRTAMVKSAIELQQPVLDSIEDLASRMDTRIDDLASRMETRIENLSSRMDKRIDKLESKLDSRLLRIEVVVFGILIPVLYIGYRIAVLPT